MHSSCVAELLTANGVTLRDVLQLTDDLTDDMTGELCIAIVSQIGQPDVIDSPASSTSSSATAVAIAIASPAHIALRSTGSN